MSRLLDLVAERRRFLSLVLTGLGIALCAYDWWLLTRGGGRPVDVHAYWAADPNNLYPPTEEALHQDAYLYSPAFELVIGWGRNLPFETFTAIWRAILLVALVWLAGPLTILVLFTVAVASEINVGNIQVLLAVAIVLALRQGSGTAIPRARWAATWAFVLLTKVTPGVGVLWYAVRRQWRALAVALGTTAAITAVTFALWPDRWTAWLRLLADGGSPAPLFPYYLPFLPRFLVACGVVVLGAWRGWRWPVVVGATLALPAFYYVSPSLLVGTLPFLRDATGRFLDRRREAPSHDQLHRY